MFCKPNCKAVSEVSRNQPPGKSFLLTRQAHAVRPEQPRPGESCTLIATELLSLRRPQIYVCLKL